MFYENAHYHLSPSGPHTFIRVNASIYQAYMSEALCPLPANIRIGRKWLTYTNTVPYYAKDLIMSVKSFMKQASWESWLTGTNGLELNTTIKMINVLVAT